MRLARIMAGIAVDSTPQIISINSRP